MVAVRLQVVIWRHLTVVDRCRMQRRLRVAARKRRREEKEGMGILKRVAGR
jgi:hypothetical protein